MRSASWALSLPLLGTAYIEQNSLNNDNLLADSFFGSNGNESHSCKVHCDRQFFYASGAIFLDSIREKNLPQGADQG